jgi:hypothetical protein
MHDVGCVAGRLALLGEDGLHLGLPVLGRIVTGDFQFGWFPANLPIFRNERMRIR